MPTDDKGHWIMTPVSAADMLRLRRWAVRNGYGTQGAAERLLQLGLDARPEPRDGPNDGTAVALRSIEERRETR